MSNGIKTVVLGEATTGKTSIVTRLVKEKFTDNTDTTIGASFVIGKNGKFGNFQFDFWDTAGQERFLSLVPMYYRKAEIILLTFDMNRLSSIDRVAYFLDKVKSELTNDFEVIIIGNKLDLVSNIDYVDKQIREKLENFSDIVGSEDYIYISTKTGQNFDLLLNKIVEKGTKIMNTRNSSSEELITLTSAPPSNYSYYSCGYCV